MPKTHRDRERKREKDRDTDKIETKTEAANGKNEAESMQVRGKLNQTSRGRSPMSPHTSVLALPEIRWGGA